jgi:cytochrome P450
MNGRKAAVFRRDWLRSPGWGARRGCINPAFSPKRSESYYRAIESVENSLPYLRLGKTFQCF